MDSVVAGGGPAGLLAAGILARAGLDVVVLEARPVPDARTRASTLHAGAMEILDRHGVPDLASILRRRWGHYAGLPLDLDAVSSPWAGVWTCAQPELVARLSLWATGNGVRVVRSEEVESVSQEDERAFARTVSGETWPARFVVAADGVDSRVRHTAGIDCDVEPARRVLLRADIRREDLKPRRFERRGDLTLVCAQTSPGTSRLMLHDPAWTRPDLLGASDLVGAWRKATHEMFSEEDLIWCEAFDDAAVVAKTFADRRVALCGDAGHRLLPVGGASLNTALASAELLAIGLVAATRDDDLELVADAARTARELATKTVERVNHQARLLFDVDADALADRASLAARWHQCPALRDRFGRAVSGTAEHGEAPPAGIRARVRQVSPA